MSTSVLAFYGVRRVAVWYEIRAAREALAARRLDVALSRLASAEWLDACHPEVQFLLARTYRRRGESERMLEHLERARTCGQPAELIEREKWLALAQSGRLPDAPRRLQALLRDQRGDGPEICEAFVSGFLANYRFDQAIGLLGPWQADYPGDPQPHMIRGMIDQHLGDDSGAASAFARALELAPERSDVRLRLAQVLVARHRYDEAANHFQQLLDVEPNNPDALLGWGECLLARGEMEEAGMILDRLLAQDPNHFRGRLARGELALQAGDYAGAVARLKPLLEQKPHDFRLRHALGLALKAAGMGAAAAEHIEFVSAAQPALQRAHRLMEQVRQEPKNAEARFEIGTILLQYDSPADGAGWLETVLSLEPRHAATHRALASYYAGIGRDDLARDHERQAESAEAVSDRSG